MDRRTFLAGTCGVLLATPLAAEAQQAAKIARIGYLAADRAANPHQHEAFRQGLRELGYVEGRNVVIEYRDAEGKLEQFPTLAAELVALKVDVIVASGTLAALAAKQATRTLLIVFSPAADPVASGLVTSLALQLDLWRDRELLRRHVAHFPAVEGGAFHFAHLGHGIVLIMRLVVRRIDQNWASISPAYPRFEFGWQ